jgi:hypothetical protein
MATSSQVGQVGIFTGPGHVIAFADGEVCQEFRAELDSRDISRTTRRRLEEGFRNATVPLIS